MSDTIVIDGEVELLNVIDGDPDVFIGGGGSQPTGTKSILLTEAGTKTEDVSSYASAEINAVTDATASGAVASFSDGAEDVPMDSCVVDIEPVQSGTGDPSPSNVRPISGWSEVNVNVTGVNVWDEQWENGSITTTTGQKASGSNVISKNYIPVRPNTTYSTTVKIRIFFYKADKTFISYVDKNAGATFTTPSECYYLLFTAFQAYGSTYNNDISINYPSTDTAYHTSVGITEYPISLGQTVYGGTLDAVTGVLTVTDGYIASYAGETLPSTWISDRDVYVQGTTPTTGAQVVYELATPTTVQLSPTEVKTLLGSNSVWADSGDIAVGYKADIFLYADSLETIIDTLTGGA